MDNDTSHQANNQQTAGIRDARAGRRSVVTVAFFVIAVAGLLLLRALDNRFDYLPVGWIIALAVIPVLPWVLPAIAVYLRAVPRYVQGFKVGTEGIEMSFREAQSDPIAVPTGAGQLTQVPNDFGALSSSTAIMELVRKLHELRRQGGGPVAIIDLQNGGKWRLPNLYFLAKLLELDPIVVQLVFTEIRGGVDGYMVGSILQGEFRRRVEQALPVYATASADPLPLVTDLTNPNQAQQLADSFTRFNSALPAPPADTNPDNHPLTGYLTAVRLQQLVGGTLSAAAVEQPGPTLGQQALRTVVQAPHQFVCP